MMAYWVFRNAETGRCLAVNEDILPQLGISDELGELLFDEPQSGETASLLIARYGGRMQEYGQLLHAS